MATLIEQADIAEDDTFIRRVRQAMIKVASDVRSEDAGTDSHSARVEFAKAVTSYPNHWARCLAYAVATHWAAGNDDASSDPVLNDATVEFQVSAVWNTFAGS